MDGEPKEVIGVTPPDFFGLSVGDRFDIALPLCQPKELRRDLFDIGHLHGEAVGLQLLEFLRRLRVRRNSFIEQWLGREGELRRRSREVLPQIDAARASGDADRGVLFMGEDAGLIDSIEPAGALVERLAAETEAILRERGELAVET